RPESQFQSLIRPERRFAPIAIAETVDRHRPCQAIAMSGIRTTAATVQKHCTTLPAVARALRIT
ncbi:MAG: hypothetical protein ACM3ZE_18530, partial [Myxococcales bacterium]